MKFFIFPYTQNSKGAIEIAAELEGKRILREGSTYEQKPDHIVINWGASDCPFKDALNHDNSAVVDKLAFFNRLKGTELTPNFSTSKALAAAALATLKCPIFCRTKTKSRDGAGIVIADTETELVDAPLYVEGINKTHEFRIHVGRLLDGTVEIIGGQKKVKKAQTPEMTNVPKDSRVWCGDTCGLVWTVGGHPVYLPPQVIQVVTAAFEKFPELTFGGFDVVYDQNTNVAYVIEINSAPMVTPETRRLYGKFFRKYATLANLPTQEQHPLGATVLQPVVAEVAPAAPVSEPQPIEVKEEVVPQQITPVPTFKATEVLDAFVTGKLSIKDLAEGYVKGQAIASEKEELVNTLQQLIIRVQG